MRGEELSPPPNTRIRRIGVLTARCPACGKRTLVIEDYLYDAPLVGLLLVSVGRCRRCGYKYSDIRAAEGRGPRRLVVRVNDPEDLSILVVKASSATIRIPELGVEVSPGPASQGFITTVEGVLRRIREVVEALCSDPSVDGKRCAEKLREIDGCLEGRRGFTLIIDDPEGVSRVAGGHVEEKPCGPEA